MKTITLSMIIQRISKEARRKLIVKELKFLGLLFAAWVLLCAFDSFLYATTGQSILFSSLQPNKVRGATFAFLLFAGPPFFILFRLVFFRSVLADRVAWFLFYYQHSIENEEYDLLHTYVWNRNKLIVLIIVTVVLFVFIALNL